MSAQVLKLRPGTRPISTPLKVRKGVGVTLKARHVIRAASMATHVQFDGRDEWLPTGSIRAAGPDGVGGLLLHVDLDVVEERGLRAFINRQVNHVDKDEIDETTE